MSLKVPTEDVEQINFVNWCRKNDIRLHHSANESYSASHAARNKKKALGQSAGFPDLLVFIREDQANDGVPHTLAIEMKRIKGSTTSKEQIDWLKFLTNMGFESHICKGSDEAKKIVEAIIYIQPNEDYLLF